MKGIYILVMELRKDSKLRIGALGPVSFPKGFYAYVGSAMGGLEQRINRHLGKSKKLHWHIDYLLKKSQIKKVIVKETSSKSEECRTAGMVKSTGGIPVLGFGCSDCRCQSHLFYFKESPVFAAGGFKEFTA